MYGQLSEMVQFFGTGENAKKIYFVPGDLRIETYTSIK